MSYDKIKRSQLATFLNTKPGGTANWARMGTGIKSQMLAYNPETDEEQYIDQDTKSSYVKSYGLNIDNPMTAHVEEPIFEYVDALRIKRATLGDAETDMLVVYLYMDAQTEKGYPSEKLRVSVQVNEFGGDAENPVELNFSINGVGDPVYGYFDPKTKKFEESDWTTSL